VIKEKIIPNQGNATVYKENNFDVFMAVFLNEKE
jgi:hypothetical protein